MQNQEIQERLGLFVLWPKARDKQEKILDDIRAHAQIVAAYEAMWPQGLSAKEGYARFYGPLLPDAVGKVMRAGTGPFFVIIVRPPPSRREWRMSQRGPEEVNVELFDMKWRYRQWTGGLHTVHGTLSDDEVRRDLMLLTNQTADEWVDGRATPAAATVLPGNDGWHDLREVFRFLGEVIPYAVMRNADELPDGLDPEHGDVDIITTSAAWCAALLNARKAPNAGEAAYLVRVNGRDVRFDIREVGDGYYDEGWQRDILDRRVLNPLGVYELSAQDSFHALIYHIVYMKRTIAPDYYAKVPALAKAAGVPGAAFGDWWLRLEEYMAQKHYRVVAPRDRTVHLNSPRIAFRCIAAEARSLFGVAGCAPVVEAADRLDFAAMMDGERVRVTYREGAWPAVLNDYEMQLAFWQTAPKFTAEPLRCHIGRSGGFLVVREPAGIPLALRLDTGWRPSPAEAGQIAAEAIRLADALDSSGVVHRGINANTLLVADGGALALRGFDAAVVRGKYKTEPQYIRKDVSRLLVPLGGDGVLRPGEWNDRYAIAQALKPLTAAQCIAKAVARLEAEAFAGKGKLRVRRRKITTRLARLYFEIIFRGIISPRRRKSAAFARVRAFVKNAFFG